MERLKLKNARLINCNFVGIASYNNRRGDRNFGVMLPWALAKELEKDGWSISNPFNGEPRPFLKVHIGEKSWIDYHFPYEDGDLVNLVIHPWKWIIKETYGIKAYLVSIEEAD